MGFQTAFICESDLVFVQVQIGFVFDTALAFVFDGNVQLLFAAFEFQIGIVVFDFRLNHMETFAARVGDHFLAKEGMELRWPESSASYSNSPLP